MAISSFPGVSHFPSILSAEGRAGRSLGQSRMGEKENLRGRRSLWGHSPMWAVLEGAWQGPWEDQGQACGFSLVAFGSLVRAAGLGGREPCWGWLSSPGGIRHPVCLIPRGLKGKPWLHGSRSSSDSVPPLSRTFTNQPASTSGGGQRCYPHLTGGELLLMLLLTFLSLLCYYQAL